MLVPEYAKVFFLRKVDEVRARAEQGDYFDLIMSAGLLRHLLLDSSPLLRMANRDHRLKLRFLVGVGIPLEKLKEVFPGSSLTLQVPGLLPGPPPIDAAVELTLDQLLAKTCLYLNGQEYSVHDILDTCAHARGGVHLRPLTPKDEALFALDSTTHLMGGEITMRASGDYRGRAFWVAAPGRCCPARVRSKGGRREGRPQGRGNRPRRRQSAKHAG